MQNGVAGIYIDRRTAATRWLGERMDYDDRHNTRRAGVSAESLECDI
jgi:hypothetical protein